MTSSPLFAFFNSSTSGFVNVYDSDSFSVRHDDNFRTTTSSVFGAAPKLIKTLGNLTTPISTLRFNHDAQILAMASKDKKDAMRLVGRFCFFGFRLFFVSLLHKFTVGRRPRFAVILSRTSFFRSLQLLLSGKTSFTYLFIFSS